MEKINKVDNMRAGGHYSLATVHNGFVFVSGQFPIDPDTREKKPGEVENEALLALQNMEAILIEAGSSRSNVLKTTLFISDISLWERVNKVYSDFFGEHKPARSVVPADNLHYGFKIEIEAIAALDQ